MIPNIYTTGQDIEMARVGWAKLMNDGQREVKPNFQRYLGETINSKQAFERFATSAGLGLFKRRSEGQAAPVDLIPPTYQRNITPQLWKLAVAWSRQSRIKDPNRFVAMMAPQITMSAFNSMNLEAALKLADGFAGGNTVLYDGKSPFATDHPLITGGTQSNLAAEAISTLAVEDWTQKTRSQLGLRGTPLMRPDLKFNLIVNSLRIGKAERAVRSSGLMGTNDHDDVKHINGAIANIIEEYWWAPLPTMLDASILLPANKADNPFIRVVTQPFTTDSGKDILTSVEYFVGEYEHTFDWISPLLIFGSLPA